MNECIIIYHLPIQLNQSYGFQSSEQQNKGEIDLFILIGIFNYELKHLPSLPPFVRKICQFGCVLGNIIFGKGR